MTFWLFLLDDYWLFLLDAERRFQLAANICSSDALPFRFLPSFYQVKSRPFVIRGTALIFVSVDTVSIQFFGSKPKEVNNLLFTMIQ